MTQQKEKQKKIFVIFERMGRPRKWVAMSMIDEITCVRWETVGTLKDVHHMIATQLNPKNIKSQINK